MVVLHDSRLKQRPSYDLCVDSSIPVSFKLSLYISRGKRAVCIRKRAYIIDLALVSFEIRVVRYYLFIFKIMSKGPGPQSQVGLVTTINPRDSQVSFDNKLRSNFTLQQTRAMSTRTMRLCG